MASSNPDFPRRLVESEDIGEPVDESALEQLRHHLLAEAVDLQRAATGHVQEPVPQLRRAGPIRAARHRVAFRAH